MKQNLGTDKGSDFQYLLTFDYDITDCSYECAVVNSLTEELIFILDNSKDNINKQLLISSTKEVYAEVADGHYSFYVIQTDGNEFDKTILYGKFSLNKKGIEYDSTAFGTVSAVAVTFIGDGVSIGGGGVWGEITGTLANQSDLNTALGLKVDKVTNKSLVLDTEIAKIHSHSNSTALNNVSGTNTGDETASTIKSKLGITTLSGSNTGDQDLSGLSAVGHNHNLVYEPVNSNIQNHIADSAIHVTAQNKIDWNAKSNFSGAYADLSGAPTIPSIDGLLNEVAHDALDHTGLTGIPTAYTLPTASDTVKGGVKIGSGLTITNEVLSANSQTDNNFTNTLKSKLDSITEIFTTALKSAYDSAVTWISTNGTNLINHLSNTSNPHSVTKAQLGIGSGTSNGQLLKWNSTTSQWEATTGVVSTDGARLSVGNDSLSSGTALSVNGGGATYYFGVSGGTGTSYVYLRIASEGVRIGDSSGYNTRLLPAVGNSDFQFPPSGSAGQVLTKGSGTSTLWQSPATGVTDHTLLTNKGTNTHAEIDTALSRLANTSGSNTGDQDLSGLVVKETGKGLSTNDYTTAEQTKLSGIEEGANNYTHPTNHAPSIITQDLNNRFVTDAEKSAWSAKSSFSGSYTDLSNKPTIPTLPIAESDVTNLTTDLSAKAPIASPTFTGKVTIPAQVIGFSTNATNGGTTTLTGTSNTYQIFTGSQNQSVQLPNATTLTLGHRFMIDNDSTQTITIKDGGANDIWVLAPGTDLYLVCSGIATSAGTWEKDYMGAKALSGKALTVNNSIVLAGTDGTTMTFPSTSKTLMASDYSNAGTAPTFNQNTTGSAATLTTARTIGGVSFDGSANITPNNTDITPPTSAGYKGTILTLTANEAHVAGDVCYINSTSKAQKAKADVIANAYAVVMATGTINSAATGTYLLLGTIYNAGWSFTAGNKIYLSAATAGAITATPPSATNNVIQFLGIALTATSILFKPELSNVEHT